MAKAKLAAAVVSRRPERWPLVADELIRQVRRPDFVVLCGHQVRRDPTVAAKDFIVSLFAAGIDSEVLWADEGQPFGSAMNSAFSACDRGLASSLGAISKIDDDDFYGPGYFREIESCLEQYDDALLIGKHGFWTVFVDMPREAMFWKAPASLPRTTYIGGPTITMTLAARRRFPGLCFPDGGTHAIDARFMETAHALWKASAGNNGEPAPFYSTGTENFVLQRWAAEEHKHTWRPPELSREKP